VRPRTRARELALQYLFSLDFQGPEALDGLEAFLKSSGASRTVREFSTLLVRGVIEHQADIDPHIRGAAENWALERIAKVDRNILRLAVFELSYAPSTPATVVIDEAVELGKRYSTAQSGAFVNGVLDRIVERIGRKPRKTAGDPSPNQNAP